ncbi:MAG TPA: hypothetical protein EYP10_01280 [Armatimonadetes bacterium]|nr:hypothetical protein [Armatimonadota bacterium]
MPGEELEGVVGALEFLRNVNAGAEMRIGERVAVIGGGNSAVDAARVVLRMGASEVTVIYRRRRAEMPAVESEVEEAEREGVKFMFLTVPKRFIGDERIRAIECVKMKLGEYDESGRRRAIPLEGSEFQMPIDQVIVAVGQVARLPFIDGKLEVDPLTLATQFEGIFAGGDVVTGPATVIEAMAGGLHAAESIDRYLRGVDLKEGRFVPPPLPTEEVLYEIEPSEAPRYEIPTLPLEQRRRTFEEIERPYDAETAMEEGKRCLRCDLERGK